MKPCKHFAIEELTPPGHQNWSLLDDRLCELLDEIHDLLSGLYAKHGYRLIMRVNTWKRGGKFKYRGWRPQDCATGSARSKHKLGQAVDFDAYLVDLADGTEQRILPDVIRKHILQWKLHDGKLKHLGGLEQDVNWCHVDSRNGGESLVQFKP